MSIESHTFRPVLKVCSGCGLAKPPEQFYKGHGRCAECVRRRVAEYRKKHPTRVKAAQDRWYQEHRSEHLQNARQRNAALKTRDPVAWLLAMKGPAARRDGIPFSLTAKDINIPEFCPVLGIRLSPVGSHRRSGNRDSAPSIDRIDASKGYVPGNVAVISNRANVIKSYGTAEEHEKIAAWMRAHALKGM
jgi:hypothetical protein